MKIGKFKKLLVSILVLSLSFGMMNAPKVVNAEGNTSTDRKDDPNVITSKIVEWDDNNNEATIKLEAYAKGSVSTSSVPLDIVLVLDQSGSMAGSNLNSLTNSVNSFIKKIHDDAIENNVDHRVGIVGYAYSDNIGGKFNNTGIFLNGTFKQYGYTDVYQEIYLNEMDTSETYYIQNNNRYVEIKYSSWYKRWYYSSFMDFQFINVKENQSSSTGYQAYTKTNVENITSQDYHDALVSVDSNGSINNDITNAIEDLRAEGTTSPYYGMKMANSIFANNPIVNSDNRKRIVVIFTDGQPGQNNNSFSDDEATRAISESYKAIHSYGADVYSVGFYSDEMKNRRNVLKFMNYISSNYPDATDFYNGGTQSSDQFYFAASNSSGLDKIFENIYSQISGSELSENAVIRDVITDVFKMPSGETINQENSDIKIYTSNYLGKDNSNVEKWGDLVPFDCTVTLNDRAVDITGFNFKENYVLDKNPETQEPSGKKIVIVIKIKPVNGFIGGDDIITNGSSSGIYANKDKIDDDTLVENFEQPDIDISLKYNSFGKNITIFESTSFNEIEEFFADNGAVAYYNNRNDSLENDKYNIDGIKNKYVDIVYKVSSQDGSKVYGVYTINHGESTGSWNNTLDFDSTIIHTCTNFKITRTVTSINNQENVINDQFDQLLHILKPTIEVNNDTVDYGKQINVMQNCVDTEGIVWNDSGNHSLITEAQSYTVKPNLNIVINNINNADDFSNNVFIPKKVKDANYTLSVKNENGNSIEPIIKNTTLNKYENTFTVDVRSGNLTIQKYLSEKDNKEDNDGSPIFTYKITVKNSLLYGESGSKVFYRYTKNPNSSVSEILKDLPVGEWTIEELGTLRYEFDKVEFVDFAENMGYSYDINNDENKITINVDNFEKNNNYRVKFSNVKKSNKKDSDNDIIINKFSYQNGVIVTKRELNSKYND